jgi:hypothetical protein
MTDHLRAFFSMFYGDDRFQHGLVLYVIEEKVVPKSRFSILENRSSLVVAIIELLNLRPSLFHSGV